MREGNEEWESEKDLCSERGGAQCTFEGERAAGRQKAHLKDGAGI